MIPERTYQVLLYSLLLISFCWQEGAFSTDAEYVSWRQAVRQPEDWYGSVEAIRIADNVLLYQRDAGGWNKNIDMAQTLSAAERQPLLKEKMDREDCTIDNGATTTQMEYLAKVFQQSGEPRFREGFLRGLDFLLSIQYDNGGFPQFPWKKGYYQHITYNDNAMIHVLDLLQNVADARPPYEFVDESQRDRARLAVEKGIQCILNTQISVNGKRTAWCAQHDENTLEPAPARTYEKISLSGSESVGIVRFLMSIENPSPEVIEAVQSAVEWFEQAKLTGIRVIEKKDPALPRGYDRIVVKDADAPPVWARFYEIGTNRPIFCGRDGIIRDSLAEIEHERRVGYSWYTNAPHDLLTEDYPEWKKKI